MIIKISDDLAIESTLICDVFYNDKKEILISLSNGLNWRLTPRSKRYFNKLIRNIREIQ